MLFTRQRFFKRVYTETSSLLTYVENIGLSRTAVCAFYVCLFVCLLVCLYVCVYDRGGGGKSHVRLGGDAEAEGQTRLSLPAMLNVHGDGHD